MTRRRVGLVIVTGCAIVLSFSGLYELAILCAFPWMLAALVPVLADAGAGLAADVWLDTSVARPVRRYACFIALSLISASVLGNATAHLLAFLGIAPPWWVVVLVGALAPAVVAANLHLYALVRNGGRRGSSARVPVLIGMPGFRFTEHIPAPLAPAGVEVADEMALAPPVLAIAGDVVASGDCGEEDEVLAKAREMAAAGVGRPTLVKELGLRDHVAREIVRVHKPRQEGLA